MPDQFPVTVAVTRPDGTREQVRVGTATRTTDGFSLELGQLSIGGQPVVASSGGARASGGAGGGAVFPPYGKSKGQPVRGASTQDLEYYANGCRRTLNDPSKSRWHDKERVLLAAIEAELARQGGDEDGPPAHGDEDAPPDSMT